MTQNPIDEPQKLSDHLSIGQIFRNIASLMASNVVNRLTSFVIYALVGRYLGAFQFGQISLALSLFYTFQVFAMAGLRQLSTREVTKKQSETNRYLVNSMFLVISMTMVSFGLMLVFVQVMGYASDITELAQTMLTYFPGTFTNFISVLQTMPNTMTVIVIICLGLLPFAMAQIFESIFMAWEKMTFIAYVNMPVNVLRITLIFIFITGGYGLYEVATIMFVSHVIVLIADAFLMLRNIIRPKLSALSFRFAFRLFKRSSAFLGMEAIIAITNSMQILLLATLLSEREAGLYSSASQLVTPLSIFYNAIILSVFPLMCRRFDRSSYVGLRNIINRLMELLMAIAIPVAIGLFFMAGWSLEFLYDSEEFREAAVLVHILTWIVAMRVITAVLGQVLIAGMKERTTVRIVAINMVIAITGGYFLVSQFGMLGAAYTSVLVVLSDVIQHYIPVSRMLQGIPMLRLMWRPITAAALMGVFLYLVDATNVKGSDGWIMIISGAFVYIISFISLLFLTLGGPKKIRAHFLGAPTVG